MTEQWVEKYMKALEKRMEDYTKENILEQDLDSKFWILRTLFPVYSDYSAHVIIQAMVFELKTDVPQIEIIVNIINDAEEENMEELRKAIEELNYISPVGAFGVREKTNRVYLRNCWVLDNKKTIEELVEDTKIYYEMMMEGVQGVYEGLRKIWTGEISYKEAVEKELLRKAED